MSPRLPRPEPARRADFRHVVPITTRWMDNDVYGHVNNVVYYSYFDTAVNQFLIEQGALDIESGSTIGLVVHSSCDYFQPLSFPGRIDAGLRVAVVGSSSIQYEVGLFGAGDEVAAACGRFVHVYVDRQTRRPQPLPQALRAAVARLQVATSSPSGEVQP
jgi:acyl-CoA thioester hydrolase